MKKKMIGILMALSITATLTACGGPGEGQPPQTQTPDAGTTTPVTDETAGSYVFPVGSDGFEVAVHADMADVLAALGEEQSYFEAASCAFDGLDKTYTYAGFMITTRPEEESDLVNSILLTDDSVTTAEGIYIGSTLAEVTAAYGESAPTDGVISYTKGECTLNIILENDTVTSIEYLPV